MEDYEENCPYCWGLGEDEEGTECINCLGTGVVEE